MATDLEPKAAPELRTLSKPDTEDRYQSLGYRAKRALLGPPFKTAQLAHERISKRVALAVFSSDPISSTAASAACRSSQQRASRRRRSGRGSRRRPGRRRCFRAAAPAGRAGR